MKRCFHVQRRPAGKWRGLSRLEGELMYMLDHVVFWVGEVQ